STFNLREIMDLGKVLLIKLDKGRLKDSANLLGSLFMAKIQMAAFSRSNIPKDERVPFYLYIDEFQNFANDSFSVILSEARKYGLSLIMAHQSLAQLPTALKSIVLGNTGIQVYFRLNRQDSQTLAKEAFEYSGFEVKSISNQNPRYWSLGEEWELHTEELQKLAPRFCYVKHKIEGGLILIQTADIYAEPNDSKMRFGLDYLIKRTEVDDYFNQKHVHFEKEVRADKPEDKPTEREVEKPKVEKSKPEPPKSKDPSTEEIYFLKYVGASDFFITEIYKELQLSGYKGDKIKNSLIEKGYIAQKETRKGKKGRLAKTLELTELGQTFLNKFENQGKGGDHHKHLQMMIKDQAQTLGWIAKIEERIPRTLETIDVGLKKDDIRVAIEISSTSKVEYEIQNIRKCLEAGFDYVLSVSDEEDVLNQIKKEARKSFTHKEKDRIRYFHPEQIKNFLINLSTGINVSEKGIVSDFITNKKQLIGAEEAAEYLGIKKSTLYDWVLQRKIPHSKIGRLLKFRIEDLDRWIEKRTKEEDIFDL
ncbi:MAG: helix-turn-helix domain-containing protein, partial [Pseudomonadota bacterium]